MQASKSNAAPTFPNGHQNNRPPRWYIKLHEINNFWVIQSIDNEIYLIISSPSKYGKIIRGIHEDRGKTILEPHLKSA